MAGSISLCWGCFMDPRPRAMAGRLRVRGGRRVRLAVYLKALACNFKRMVHARLVEMEKSSAATTTPLSKG